MCWDSHRFFFFSLSLIVHRFCFSFFCFSWMLHIFTLKCWKQIRFSSSHSQAINKSLDSNHGYERREREMRRAREWERERKKKLKLITSYSYHVEPSLHSQCVRKRRNPWEPWEKKYIFAAAAAAVVVVVVVAVMFTMLTEDVKKNPISFRNVFLISSSLSFRLLLLHMFIPWFVVTLKGRLKTLLLLSLSTMSM